MNRLTNEQRLQIIELYYKNQCSVRKVFRDLRPIYGLHNRPSEQTINAIVTKFRTQDTLLDIKPTTRMRTVRTEENIASVSESVAEDREMSIRRRSQQLGLCYSTTWKILRKDLGKNISAKKNDRRVGRPKKGDEKPNSDDENYLSAKPEKSPRGKKLKHRSGRPAKKGNEKSKKLKKDEDNNGDAEDDDNDDDDDQAEYEVEKIVDVHFKRNGEREFLIRWKGFKADADTWEPEDNVSCADLIEKYMKKVDDAKSKDSKDLPHIETQ